MPPIDLCIELVVELELVEGHELEQVHANLDVRCPRVVSADELAQQKLRRDPERSLCFCAQRNELCGGGAARDVLHVCLTIGHRVGA
eukprot:4990876-Prymnesium_polylepis.1